MGNAQSSTAHGKLSSILPPSKKMGHDEKWNYVDQSMGVFIDTQDREQFIRKPTMIVTKR